MPTAYKILGQSAPASTANTDLYTVGAGVQTVVSTLVITNTTATAATARVFVRANAAAAAASNAVVYDTSIAANSMLALTLGICVDASDVITVQTGTSNALTFQAFGSEIS